MTMATSARRAWTLSARARRNLALFNLLCIFLIFLALTHLIRTPALQHLDLRITLAIQRFRAPWLDDAARLFTWLGNSTTLIVLGACSAFAFFRTARPRTALFFFPALLGHPLDALLKPVFGRARPTEDLVQVIVHSVGLSFPSGHAMATLLFYGFLAFQCWLHVPHRPIRLFFTTLFSALIVGIGASRIYLGDHWFSDVIGGWTAGLFCLLLLAHLYKLLAREELKPPSRNTSDKVTR